ncbi:MAG: sigma factor-like helix-turn-helix DNA-binding protein [bacterium]|nr:sigma factor-like helix-turn-helix DNA-binding protein [bacterium]
MIKNSRQSLSARMQVRVAQALNESFGEIAVIMDISVETVRKIATGNKKPFETREQKERGEARLEKRVVELRATGLSNKAIAKKLKQSRFRIGAIAMKLIREGRIVRRSYGRTPMPDEVKQERELRVAVLRARGLSEADVAKDLGMTTATIEKYFPLPVTERQSCVGTTGRSTVRDINCDRVRTIILLVNRTATLKEIGEAFNVTRERARQLISEVKSIHGESVFQRKDEREKKVWTISEAASELGVSKNTVARLCRTGVVVFERRSTSELSAFVIDEENLAKLRCHPLVTGKCTCEICGDGFVVGRRSLARKVCDKESCVKERNVRRRAVCVDKETTLQSVQGWHKEVFLALTARLFSEEAGLLTLGLAAKCAGISNMQLSWLRKRNMVNVREDAIRTWRGRPITLYLVSEMKEIRRVVGCNGCSRPKKIS